MQQANFIAGFAFSFQFQSRKASEHTMNFKYAGSPTDDT